MEPSITSSADMIEKIDEQRIECAPQVGKNLFVPADKLQEILTKPNVKVVLREKGLGHTSELAEFVMSRARTIFLALVWTEKLTDLRTLKANGVDDGVLPIGRHVKGKKVSSLSKNTSALTDAAIPILSNWQRSQIESFVSFHWSFQAPSFSQYKYLKLALNCPLPLCIPARRSNTRTYSGSSAEVHQLELLDNSWRGPGESQVSSHLYFSSELFGAQLT